MFRHLPVFSVDLNELQVLADGIIQADEPQKPVGDPDDDENPAIPAGYTYLGQFIDHDITFDPVSLLSRQNDPDGLVDFRTPKFDLDSLYGRGPSDQPYLYEDDGIHLRLGRDVGNGRDLIRTPEADPETTGRALIGDPRNDENLIVSQLQVLFIKFHNTVIDQVASEQPTLSADDRLKEAQRLVRWHYQWIVVHDFLRHILGDPLDLVLNALLPERVVVAIGAGGSQVNGTIRGKGLEFFTWQDQPYMPVEFSAAAYRYGHSMIRPSYLFNEFVRDQRGPDAPRTPIFSDDADPLANMNGFRPLPQQWGFEWKFFFEIAESGTAPQASYKIDGELVHPLGALPGPAAEGISRSLAHRNLLRGARLNLPAGQDVARAMGFEPLTATELALPAGTASFADRTPLWFYLLREAESLGEGARLGPVGGRLVAEVLVGLLLGDPLSYLNVQPNWTPSLAPQGATDFTMSDLVRLVGAA